jgi:hypothetical protein
VAEAFGLVWEGEGQSVLAELAADAKPGSGRA